MALTSDHPVYIFTVVPTKEVDDNHTCPHKNSTQTRLTAALGVRAVATPIFSLQPTVKR